MNESFRLGRIAGIPVGINWSVLVILWLLAWSLAVGYLPTAEPGYEPTEYWLVGIAAAVVFLTSLLAHEMGHALVAIRSGVGVHGITLWLFGGVSKLDSEATTPQAELRIALMGPAVSLGIAAAAGALAAVLAAVDAPDLAVAAFVWLATINVVLGVFNLMPAAPLDGGRVLKAILWRRRGDHLSATLSAADAGRVFGFVLIGLGILQAAAGAAVPGLWMVFLGWFLLSAAKAEQTQAVVMEGLAGVPVHQIMTAHPVVVGSGLPVRTLLDDVVMRHQCSAFPVVGDDGRVRGLLTLSRVKELDLAARDRATVDQVAAPIDEVVRSSPEEMVVDLLPRMGASRDGRALVFDGDELVGIVTPTDVVRMSEMAMLRVGR